MDNIYWLLAANAVIWLGLGAYIAFLGCKGAALHKRLRHMEMLHGD